MLLKSIKMILAGISFALFANPVYAEKTSISGSWQFNVASQRYMVRLQEHTYPSEVAPISGEITTPEKKSIAINKCSDQQMATGGKPPYISYINRQWPTECSYINIDPTISTPLVVLRTSLKFVWIFTVNDNGKAVGAIFDRSNGKKAFDISGQKVK